MSPIMTDRSAATVEILADDDALAVRAAQWLRDAIRNREGMIAISLSGGSTPRKLYELLAGADYRTALPWPRLHWFWGDERFVPPDDKNSNFRMVREALLSKAPIPPANIHAIPTQGQTPGDAARAYEQTLKSFYGADRLDPHRPLFDVTLLGLGEDGHTASLLPGAATLDERARWVVPAKQGEQDRITLTVPALNSSRHAAFLVSGRGKADILVRLRRGDNALPASHIRPTGVLRLFADKAAAGVD
jgi:6-phosphogluconolactonase